MTHFPYEEDPGQTHYEGCWKHKGHHNCAVARIEELEADVADAERHLSMGLAPNSERQELHVYRQAFLVLRAKLLETGAIKVLVDGLLLQPLVDYLGKETYEKLLTQAEEIIGGQLIRLPKQGGFASHEFIHLKPAKGINCPTIYYCGGAHSESDQPPSTYRSKSATCPQCLIKHREYTQNAREKLKK